MAITSQEVWQLLAELIEAQKETDRKFQETAHQFKETDRKFQETDRKFQETDLQFKETDRRLRVSQQWVDEKLGKLGNRLGDFVEWQVRPAALRLFQERGIAVNELSSNLSVQQGDDGIEVDLLAVNSTEAVVVEVKSKVTETDVDDHLERLNKFKQFLPRYQNLRILGAIAGLVMPQDVARYAYRKGFFVIAQSGDNLVILNDAKFSPRVW